MTFDQRIRRRFWEANAFRTLLMMLAVMAFAAGFLTIGFAAGRLTTRTERGLLERCIAAGEYALPIVLWADSVRHVQIESVPGLAEHIAEFVADGAVP